MKRKFVKKWTFLARNEQVACSNQVSSSKNPAKLRLKRKVLRDFFFSKIETSEKTAT